MHSKHLKTILDEEWPSDELEVVNNCPYCGSAQRRLAYSDAQDWSFFNAPGKWTYWDCSECEALYLSPRPTEKSIVKAYSKYYTHGKDSSDAKEKFKVKLKNECFSHWLNVNIQPRLNLPKFLGLFLLPLKLYITIPFGLEKLVSSPKGKLIDVGCGSGTTLKIAQQLGWDVMGIEVDARAVKTARQLNLHIIQGDYRRLKEFPDHFDCIVCSHVLEHVHNPQEMILLLLNALRTGGVLLLSLPNSKSHVKYEFGSSWRGLEAPRHIGIPSLNWLRHYLIQKNLLIHQVAHIGKWTKKASLKIMKLRGIHHQCFDFTLNNKISQSESDFIQFECTKR